MGQCLTKQSDAGMASAYIGHGPGNERDVIKCTLVGLQGGLIAAAFFQITPDFRQQALLREGKITGWVEYSFRNAGELGERLAHLAIGPLPQQVVVSAGQADHGIGFANALAQL